jgi:hypothetical protein
LIGLTRQVLDYVLSPRAVALQRLVVGESGRSPERAGIFYASEPQAVVSRLADEFERLTEDGRVRQTRPDHLALQFRDLTISSLIQLSLWGLSDATNEAQGAEHIAEAVDIPPRLPDLKRRLSRSGSGRAT